MQRKAIDQKHMWDKEWSTASQDIRSTHTFYLLSSEDTNNKIVLDVGSGDPYYASSFKHSKQFVGVDVSGIALRSAKNISPQNDHVVADAMHLPFKSSVFDSVFSLETLTPLGEGMLSALKEMTRVSKDSVIFTVSHDDSFKFYGRVPVRNLEYGSLYTDNVVDQATLDEKGLRSMLKDLKLEPKEIEMLTEDWIANAGTPIYTRTKTKGGQVKQAIYVRALRKDTE